MNHREGLCCFAFHWIWRLYSEWFYVLGCLSQSNNLLHNTIYCNDCINTEFKTTQSPQGLTEASILFENVLIIFFIFLWWIFASDWILQPVQIYTSIAAGIHSKILNHSCHIFMIVNMPADLLYFCLGQPTHFNFCEGLDSPAHFDICDGWLDSPTHFDFC